MEAVASAWSSQAVVDTARRQFARESSAQCSLALIGRGKGLRTHQRVLRASSRGAPATRPGVARAAQSTAVSDGAADPENTEEKELPSPAQAEEEAGAGPPADAVAAVRAALSSGDSAVAEAEVLALQQDRDALVRTVDAMEKDLTISKERILRLSADFDNFRKRSERERAALASSVKGDVVEALLPMVDSFERAKSAIKLETEAEQRIDAAYQGIYKQFVEVMKNLGVAAVETVGKEFNPEVHEAIMREESLEFVEGVVSQEFRKGFVIGERLVRPAMVKVSTGPGPSPAAAGDSAGPEGAEAGASTGEATE